MSAAVWGVTESPRLSQLPGKPDELRRHHGFHARHGTPNREMTPLDTVREAESEDWLPRHRHRDDWPW